MAKKIVSVDENLLRDYMSGDISGPLKVGDVEQDESSQRESETKMRKATDTGMEKGKTCRKREEESDYREKYLKNNPVSYRIQVYVNRRLYEHIKHYLPVIAPDVSISSYISNIVAEHVELHVDEINKMYKDRFSPLNKYDKYGD